MNTPFRAPQASNASGKPTTPGNQTVFAGRDRPMRLADFLELRHSIAEDEAPQDTNGSGEPENEKSECSPELRHRPRTGSLPTAGVGRSRFPISIQPNLQSPSQTSTKGFAGPPLRSCKRRLTSPGPSLPRKATRIATETHDFPARPLPKPRAKDGIPALKCGGQKMESIIGTRINKKDGKTEYLVRWKGSIPDSWQKKMSLQFFMDLLTEFEERQNQQDARTFLLRSPTKADGNLEDSEDSKGCQPKVPERSGKDEYVVERILGHRPNSHTGGSEYLVKWKDYSDDKNTWEPKKNLTNCGAAWEEYAYSILKQVEW
ncbi:Fc.00g004860.m01.CDS01 [Cosmosporella sp. VM-42]